MNSNFIQNVLPFPYFFNNIILYKNSINNMFTIDCNLK